MHLHLQSPPPRVGHVAVPFASTTAPLTRRSLCTAALVLPTIAIVAVAAPATPTATSTAFRVAAAHYDAAKASFLALPARTEVTNPAAYQRAERHFFDALSSVERAPVADWHEFAAALEIVAGDGGLPSEGTMDKLIADAHRLAGEA